jgi:hypothetical protein
MLAFLVPDETGEIRKLAHDYREPTNHGWEYEFVVRGNTNKPCHLSIGENSIMPEQFDIVLYDHALNQYFDLIHAREIVLPRIPDEKGIRYSLFVGEKSNLLVEDDALTTLPGEYDLEQNYPNPFNPSTVIRFSLPVPEDVRIEVYNVLGQRVSVLHNGILHAGNHNLVWDGKDDNGTRVSSGVYFCRMVTDNYTASRKMVLLY